ncbi:MAG: FAD-binding oxidoreductase [bacterium]|nr:FAD-binding oxidoreductase [bacterium]
MNLITSELKNFFKGEVLDDDATLETYSRDASLLKVRPKLVVFPKDTEDLSNLVRYIEQNKGKSPELSLTIRAAGSCMSGGPLNESIIADVTKHMNKIGHCISQTCTTEPGAFYRDFEKNTLSQGLILPCYPASKDLCAVGGMIANNCGGEKTLRYGKMENFVLESKVIFSDGNEYSVKPLSKQDLEEKISQNNFEGNLYKQIFELIEQNKEVIEQARPKISKNSAGYSLWNVCPSMTLGVKDSDYFFDLNKLLVGSQGTLGVVTETKIRLVEVESASKLFVIFLHDLSHLSELVNAVLPTKPDSIESYDDRTLKLAFRFFPEMLRSMKAKHFFSLVLSFIPELFMMLRGGIPKLIVLVEYAGQTAEEVDNKMNRLEEIIRPFKVISRKTISEEESSKYWTIRRESFSLLRKHVHNARTAPFVDDVVVKPEDMPAFLPKMRAILDEYKLNYTIAGHAGDGNFHIIPLMDMRDGKNIEIIKEVGDRVYSLVAEYHGSISGEHNDGIIRTPYLGKMYSPEVLELFKKTKEIFDPQNIFNPGKKVPSTVSTSAQGSEQGRATGLGQVGGSLEYLESHLAIE